MPSFRKGDFENVNNLLILKTFQSLLNYQFETVDFIMHFSMV